jgi:hypothetical protein
MGVLSFLKLGKQAGDAIASPVEAVGSALDKLFTSGEERAQASALMEKIKQKPHILQAELNKVQAQHRSLFVAGARPFILWICGVGLSFAFIINPIIQWWTGEPGPKLPLDTIMELIVCILGLGGLRTFEKYTKVSK